MAKTHVANRWTYRDDVSRDLSSTALEGYDVEAADGHIGKIDEANAETGSACMVVDTGFWIFGKKRLIPAGAVTSVDHAERTVRVNLTKAQVKDAPDFDAMTSRYRDEEWRRDYDYFDPYIW